MAGLLFLAGCGDAPSVGSPAADNLANKAAANRQDGAGDPERQLADGRPPSPNEPSRSKRRPSQDRPLVTPGSELAQALGQEPASKTIQPPRVPEAPLRPVDDDLLREHGIRTLKGKYIVLYTDLEAQPDIDELPEVFDQAVPQWQKYCGMDEDTGWRVSAYLAKDKQKFWRCGLWDDSLPDFASGFTQGREFWMYEQPNAYYRRHLMLHEGTHAFFFAHVSDTAPPWYNEGMAEYFGTHRWANGQLTTGYYPANRDEVPLWGRVKLVKDAFAARKALTLPKVLALGPRAHLVNESYGWTWAAGAFFEGHPKYRDKFRTMYRLARRDNFNQLVQEAYGDDWRDLQEEWQIFVANIDYGYDFERMAVEFAPGEPLPVEGAAASVAADRSWQSSGIRLAKNKAYQIAATGRFQLKQEPKVWWSEAGGVSLHYFGGSPLGVLQAAVRPDEFDPTVTSPLLLYDNVGQAGQLLPTHDGTLYLRINDSPGGLADNAGELEVLVKELPPSER